MATKIEWTDETWNQIIGCSKTSPGCQNCYAERMAKRQWWMHKGFDHAYHRVVKIGYDGGPLGWNGKTAFVESALDKPLHWRKPRKIFVCSMGDLFHESVPFEWIDKVFAIIALCPQHTFQILTKRPERMWEYFRPIGGTTRMDWIVSKMASILNVSRIVRPAWPLPNLWLGTSTENQEQADKRLPHLLQFPAVIHFMSGEPLIEPVLIPSQYMCGFARRLNKTPIRCNKLDWVICGGESGPKARPMHPDSVRSLRDQCKAAGVPFMFKQWGEWAPAEIYSPSPSSASFYRYVADGKTVAFRTSPKRHSFDSDDPNSGNVCAWRVGKPAAGRKLDGVEHLAFPEVAK